jgi:hypothetical protein
MIAATSPPVIRTKRERRKSKSQKNKSKDSTRFSERLDREIGLGMLEMKRQQQMDVERGTITLLKCIKITAPA